MRTNKMNLQFEEPLFSLSDIENLISKNNKFIVYGADNFGLKCKKVLESIGKTVIGFVDLDKIKTKNFKNNQILDIENICLDAIIIIASYHSFQIAKKLTKEFGLKYYDNYVFWGQMALAALPRQEYILNSFGSHFYYFYKKHLNMYKKVYDFLSDEHSKDILFKIIYNRIHFFNPDKISIDNLPTSPEIQKKYESDVSYYYQLLPKSIPQRLKESIAFKISLNTYSYRNIVSPVGKKVIFDIGAYNNTAAMFSFLSPDSIVYAFEPQEKQHEDNLKLSKTFKNIRSINKAAWKNSGTIGFDTVESYFGGTADSRISLDSKKMINVVSIDDFVILNNIDDVDFIKMEIEGAEYEALLGANKTITKFKPDLAICTDHKPEHLFEIPILIKKIHKDYNIYMDHRYFEPVRTICFATINK